jgi:hypothetical protein
MEEIMNLRKIVAMVMILAMLLVTACTEESSNEEESYSDNDSGETSNGETTGDEAAVTEYTTEETIAPGVVQYSDTEVIQYESGEDSRERTELPRTGNPSEA